MAGAATFLYRAARLKRVLLGLYRVVGAEQWLVGGVGAGNRQPCRVELNCRELEQPPLFR
jgi:hypothetical protein